MVTEKVSVFSFFYNQEKFVKERIESIFSQGDFLGEVYLIDDNSTDKTYSNLVSEIDELFPTQRAKIHLIKFSQSSGFAGGRWYLLSRAKFPFIWIAEGDDSSKENFLSVSIMKLEDNLNCSFSWAQSYLVDENNRSLGIDVNHHSKPHGTTFSLLENVYGGNKFVSEEMCHYNPLPNVSACLFRKNAILKALEDFGFHIMHAPIAADWILYLALLSVNNLYVISEPLNIFRRRINSVSQSIAPANHFWEFVAVQNFASNLFLLNKQTETYEKQRKERDNLAVALGIRTEVLID